MFIGAVVGLSVAVAIHGAPHIVVRNAVGRKDFLYIVSLILFRHLFLGLISILVIHVPEIKIIGGAAASGIRAVQPRQWIRRDNFLFFHPHGALLFQTRIVSVQIQHDAQYQSNRKKGTYASCYDAKAPSLTFTIKLIIVQSHTMIAFPGLSSYNDRLSGTFFNACAALYALAVIDPCQVVLYDDRIVLTSLFAERASYACRLADLHGCRSLCL